LIIVHLLVAGRKEKVALIKLQRNCKNLSFSHQPLRLILPNVIKICNTPMIKQQQI